MTTPRLVIRKLTKCYPKVLANNAVSLTLMPGEIHAVLGENGAGKSTLMKMIYGVETPDSGRIEIDGRPVRIRNPRQARSLGISMVFQHFSLFDSMTVAENVWLGLGKGLSLQAVRAGIREKGLAYGLEIEPNRPVHTLSVGEMQRVEIIRALLGEPRILILDEPTSVLTPQAVERLFVVLRRLAAEGCSILYISHKMHEIRALCTACTVLRAGRVSGSCNPQEETDATLSRMMLGVEPAALPSRTERAGEVVLQVQDLTLPSTEAFGQSLHHVSLQVRAGEVVGIAGVSGNGQRELMMALSGEDRRAEPNNVLLFGVPIGHVRAQRRRALGLRFVPEERLGRAAVPGMNLAQNYLLTHSAEPGLTGWWLPLSRLHKRAMQIIKRFHVKASGSGSAAKSLSGGNLQKFIVGREIEAEPKLLILSQPTWGVDVGAAAFIHQEILRLREGGAAVLLVSEELEELLALSDRLYVIAKGRVSPSIQRTQATVEQIGTWMGGQWETAHV